MGSVLINKILFSGCSFTWGQGLWYYCNTNEYIPNTYEYLNNIKKIPQQALDFKDKNNWPGLVSSYFDSKYEMKSWNGGTDIESIRFIENKIFKNNEKVDWVIFQTTQTYRSPFYFEHKGKHYNVKSEPGQENLDEVVHLIDGPNGGREVVTKDFDIFLDWLIDNNYKFEDWQDLFEDTVLNKIESVLKKCNEMGIKTSLICWTSEYLNKIEKNDYLNNQRIRLTHKNRTFECIEQLMDSEKNLSIIFDENKKHISGDGSVSNDDWHPSLECHKIISKSVINHINNYKK